MSATSYLVNEVFESFQGEGSFTGTPAVFVRLQGCPVGCPWCDTQHTWQVDKQNAIGAPAMMAKGPTGTSLYARMDASAVADAVKGFRSPHVVVTGGEPALFPLEELCAALAPRRVQLETSGTAPLRGVPDEVFVTCSPKIGMPGARSLRTAVVQRADEIKVPVRNAKDVEVFEALALAHVRDGVPIYLQPIDLLGCGASRPLVLECLAWARERDWRVSLQTHKWLQVR